jgi:hypothetical protein
MQLSYLIILACSVFMGVNASASPAFTTPCFRNGNLEVCTEDGDCCSGCCVGYVGGLRGGLYIAIDAYDTYSYVCLAEGGELWRTSRLSVLR